MLDSDVIKIIALIISLLGLFFGTGWFIRNRPKVEILEPLLVREHSDQGFGLKFEGKIINEGNFPTIAKTGKAFLYLSNGKSIKTNFAFGIKKMKEPEGHLLPQTLEPHSTYDIVGFELQPHSLWSDEIREIFDRKDLTLRIKIKCSNLKTITFRCNTRVELDKNFFISILRELIASFREMEI